LKFFLIISFLYCSADAYELPKVEFSQEQKPTITLFSAESIVVENVKKYRLKWKTENATHVQITFLGNVELSGSVIITEQEYQSGPITLTATSTKNSFTDSKTINKFIKADREAPILIKKEREGVREEFHSSPMPYRMPYRRRIPPRRIRPY